MKRLILAGGGHAHLFVLKALAERRWAASEGLEVVLVSPEVRQMYSGMVPGWMAGHYTLDQCAAALEPLAAAAGVRFVQDRVVGLDARQRQVLCASGEKLDYDLLSLDTGADVKVAPLQGAGDKLLAIRPLEQFLGRWSAQLSAFKAAGRANLAVVGGGAAGVELALAAQYRLRNELGAGATAVTLVTGETLMAGHHPRVVARVEQALQRAGITLVSGHALGVPSGLQWATGDALAVDGIIAATGVQPAAWLADSGLALALDGFVAVGGAQQSTSHPEVFAGGDVASRVDAPHAKSGVYAVRAGPVLAHNLECALAGQPLRYHSPQKRSLYLMATGPRRAIVSWGSLSAEGRWAWRWKDWIDRRFMRQYELVATPITGD